MSRQIPALAWVCLLLLALPVMVAQSEMTMVSDEIQVEGWPDPLVLGYGETKDFPITVHNTGDRTLGIYMDWVSCECIYGHSGTVSERYIELGPGGSHDVTVTVTSGSRVFGENDGEGMLRFEWGPNLTMVDGRPDDLTVEDHEGLDINVQDDAAGSYLVIFVIIAFIVLAIAGAVLIVLMRGRSKERTR